jgi:gliding motility-associated-like protein
MTKALPILCLLCSYHGWAQCGFTASLHTNKDHCLGSSIIVSSAHALQKIIWYKDGAVVGTVTGTNSFNPTPKTVAGGHGMGTGASQFSTSGVAVDAAGNIFVSDGPNNRVQKWAPGASAGITVAGGHGTGNGPDQLAGPFGIFVDESDNIYIADEQNWRIQKWAPGASSGVTVAGGNGRGLAAGQLQDPTDVYVTCNGDLYISDGYADRVVKWPAGASAGTTIVGQNNRIGTTDPINDPTLIGVDGQGNVYLSELGLGQISFWAPGSTGGSLGTGLNAWGMWVDKGGDVYICSNGNNKIQEWVHGGNGWQTILTTPFKANAGFTVPFNQGIGMDGLGNLYVGDEEQYSVLEFERATVIDSSYTPTVAGVYSATVIDLNGDTASTGPFVFSTPFSGPAPAIQINSTATNVAVCMPVNFTATVTNPGVNATYQWQVSGVDVGNGGLEYGNNVFANGDKVWCILQTDTGCSATPVSDTSNVIDLSIDPQGHATITIAASDTAVCAGTPIDFTSSVMNAAANPGYDWMVNGVSVGDSGPDFIDSNAVGGQVVYCLIASDASCGLAKSNSIPVTIYPLPVIAPGQVFSVPYGKSVQLDPVVSGDIASYAWTPGTGLSDTAIRDPVADPSVTTTYTLSVTSFGGCKTSGEITADIYTQLSIPNAFTPNGDGRNDVFYVLGGPAGSVIKEFAVFNRWGQRVFQVHDVAPGDPAFGWNGYIHGAPAPRETYVYMVEMAFPGGGVKVYKGTVVLVR